MSENVEMRFFALCLSVLQSKQIIDFLNLSSLIIISHFEFLIRNRIQKNDCVVCFICVFQRQGSKIFKIYIIHENCFVCWTTQTTQKSSILALVFGLGFRQTFPVKNAQSKTMANVLVDELINRNSAIRKLLSYQVSSQGEKGLWLRRNSENEYCGLLPQTNRKTERFIKIL